MSKKKKILITGAAGFIGFHVVKKIQIKKKKYSIVGIDNLNNYYSKKLKFDRLKILKKDKNFIFKKIDIKNFKLLQNLFNKYKFDYVVHLAAQAGVRHSLKKPREYLQNNLVAFFNLLECCKINKIKHLIFASTSSVYGASKEIPFKESQSTDHPIQFYAATKKSNEVMAHSYSYIYNLPCTGLRFFTVYGPWGRPDMALYKFTKNIMLKKKIDLYNYGNHKRDFTFVEDVAHIIEKLIKQPPTKSNAPFRILNLGKGSQTKLTDYLKEIEKNLGIKGKINLLPLQVGDIFETKSDIKKLKKLIKFKKFTNVKRGIKLFIEWYKEYFKVKIYN